MRSLNFHLLVLSGLFWFSPGLLAQEPISIGTRLELFVDDFLIDKLTGSAKQHLHQPEPKEVVLVTKKPWEGNTCAYYTIFQDGDKYRMYYRGSHFDEKTKKATHPEVTCYAESKDGITWTRPKLGLFSFDGSKNNNIVWDGLGTHNFTPFKDTNPNCPPDARYKALAVGRGEKFKNGLYAFKSPDGIHWQMMSKEPVITQGAFDSQNLAFWDPHAKLYREYHRGFRDKVRDIMTGTSTDFLKWTEPKFINISGAPKQHLYTNTVQPYQRAPHILLGFPTRFLPKTEQTEPTLMSSRDGLNFHRWEMPVIPLTAPEGRDGNRSNYMAWGMVKLPKAEKEYSMYATEAYYKGQESRLRRFTYRVDGFVSIQAGEEGGELLTKPLTFKGKLLMINFKAGNKGSLRVEVQDGTGQPIKGFTLADCPPFGGDAIRHLVTWKEGSDLSMLQSKSIRLRFELKNADLYSLQFVEKG